jgi:DNA-binding NarL/FixJ family response regulator
MTPSDFETRSIALVVDDNPESLGMVSAALESHGMTVLVARDGRSAINLTHRVQPDVILMDAMMPEMDGFETCRALKFGPNPVLAPIIFMTGLSDQEHIVKGLRAGGVDYITKPVELDEMIARLSTHIVNSKLIQSARDALDSCGRAILAFDQQGELAWGSQKALGVFSSVSGDLPMTEFKAWIAGCVEHPLSAIAPYAHGTTSFHFVGVSIGRDYLVKITRLEGASNEEKLRAAFDLTARESEVLFWLTLGKTNRDISAILDLSARTVNKHLEQVFQKMGVDNRTSAAVLADRVLARDG